MIKIGPITMHDEFAQGSDEWHRIRSGSLGSSEFATAAGTGKTRDALLEAKVIAETTGIITQGYSNAWMNRGNWLESKAADWLEQELCRIYAAAGTELIGLTQVGMVQHDEFPGLHSSPDRLVDTGLWPMPVVEIKCPSPAVHLKYLADWVKHGAGWHPTKYRWQIKVHRVVFGDGCWFCSWHPDCEAQVLSWIPPATEAEKQEVRAVLDRWRRDLEIKRQDIDRLLIRMSTDEQKKEVETAALIEAAKKMLQEVAI
jgi:hypothetical protein